MRFCKNLHAPPLNCCDRVAMPSKSGVKNRNMILQWILLANLCLHIRVNAETKISPKEVTTNNATQQCFTCTMTQQETHWLVNGVYKRGNATPNGDLRVDIFCSNFTSNTTVACFGEPTNSTSETDSAQVIIINEVSAGLPTGTTGTAGTVNTAQPTFIPPFKPPDVTAITVAVVVVVLIVIAVVLTVCVRILLYCRHKKKIKKENTADTYAEDEEGWRTGDSSHDSVALSGGVVENGVYEPEGELLSNEEEEEEEEKVDVKEDEKEEEEEEEEEKEDEKEEEEEMTVLAPADPTTPVGETHPSKLEPISSFPEPGNKARPCPRAQCAPVDPVKDKELCKIIETGQDSPNGAGTRERSTKRAAPPEISISQNKHV